MRFILSLVVAIILAVPSAFAVTPPSVKSREKAEAERKKEIKQKVKDTKKSGCPYGKDVKTGGCYEPKEGQFYRDPVTGKVKVKKIKKINTPW